MATQNDNALRGAPIKRSLLYFGPMLARQFAASPPAAGSWYAELCSRGPVLCSLGIVAAGFSTRADVEAWREAEEHQFLPQSLFVAIEYEPTLADIERWSVLPEDLNVRCFHVSRAVTLNDGWKSRRAEAWATLEEARHRAQALERDGATDVRAECVEYYFSRTPTDLAERESLMRRINGAVSAIARVSAPGALNEGDSAWDLYAYVRAGEGDAGRHYRETRAVYADQVKVATFQSREEARKAGQHLVATNPLVFGYVDCPAERRNADAAR